MAARSTRRPPLRDDERRRQVLSPEGKHLGTIPTPRGVITAAFGGKDKKMLYILARGATDANGTEVANAAQVWAIQMIAQGYKGRAK